MFGVNSESVRNEPVNNSVNGAYIDVSKLCILHKGYIKVTKSDEESNQVKGEKELSHPKLTKQQEDIRNFCSIPRTAQEIMDRLGITNQSKNRQRHIQPLLDMGVLEMTNPENPTANNQRYRRAPKK